MALHSETPESSMSSTTIALSGHITLGKMVWVEVLNASV